jgi:hypothetical protein
MQSNDFSSYLQGNASDVYGKVWVTWGST